MLAKARALAPSAGASLPAAEPDPTNRGTDADVGGARMSASPRRRRLCAMAPRSRLHGERCPSSSRSEADPADEEAKRGSVRRSAKRSSHLMCASHAERSRYDFSSHSNAASASPRPAWITAMSYAETYSVSERSSRLARIVLRFLPLAAPRERVRHGGEDGRARSRLAHRRPERGDRLRMPAGRLIGAPEIKVCEEIIRPGRE